MAATEVERALQGAVTAAVAQVQAGLVMLDREMQASILEAFESAADRVARVLQDAAGPDGLIPREKLREVVSNLEAILGELKDRQESEIRENLIAAAENGAGLISDLRDGAKSDDFPSDFISRLPDYAAAVDEVMQQVLHAYYADGLNLSDRLWRNYQALREDLLPAIQAAVIQGISARDAARESVLRAGAATAAQLAQIEQARAGALSARAKEILASPEAGAYANALRVFRTEIDRANMLASRAGIFATHGVVGTRFKLSPAHPRFDICDMHASVNLYGLGPGGYPPGRSPLPAHPNTLSFEEAIFEWEVTPGDRAHRDDLLSWLADLSDEDLLGVLGAQGKVNALRAGQLQADEITTPWRALRAKYPHLEPA